MRPSRFSEEQIIAILREQEAGAKTADVCRRHAFIEAFNARLRDECLNETLFTCLAHARAVLDEWKRDYNTGRPHSGIGNLTPVEFAISSAGATQRATSAQMTKGSTHA